MSTNATMEAGTYLAAFDRLDANAPVHALRAKAFERFNELGFPTTAHEEWRYTNVKPIADGSFHAPPTGAAPVTMDMIREHLLPESKDLRAVFVNGRYAPELSDLSGAKGIRLRDLASVMAEDFAAVEGWLDHCADSREDAFAALNTAFVEDGAFLHLPRGTVLEAPIELLFVTAPGPEPSVVHPRVLIVADASSQATIVESYVSAGQSKGLGPCFTNAVTEIVAGENTVIDHYKIVLESEETYHVASHLVDQARASNVTSHNFTIGGRLVRNHLGAALNDEGCESTFNGLFLTHREQHVDNHLRVDHLAPNCNSWEFYKGILNDKSRGVFRGLIYVAEDAQKTDAKQTNMNLLLSDEAMVFTKPQLEIFADDVKCTHGATIGQLEPSQLFYLQARGIDRDAARSLLIYAFANETISEVRVPALRAQLERLLVSRLPQAETLHGGL